MNIPLTLKQNNVVYPSNIAYSIGLAHLIRERGSILYLGMATEILNLP